MGWRPHKVGGEIGSNPVWATKLWGGAVVARRAHNPKVRGSTPLPATKTIFEDIHLQHQVEG